ncbi:MAG: hypothetical protein IJM50_07110 [Lachnospiraceae bacterium]|nr:hypothetical protein [Lachnospiraceae bacterium]
MELLHERVIHKKYGKGVITDVKEPYFFVTFNTNVIEFRYPDAFTIFLSFEDEDSQKEVIIELDRRREELIRQEEEQRKRIQAYLEELETQAAAIDKKKNEKTFSPRERVKNTVFTYLVFQGVSFEEEAKGGFIWAPKNTPNGGTCHFWDRLIEVKPGDIIFHSAKAHIRAVSVAEGEAFDCDQPEGIQGWEREGRMVKSHYYLLKNPLKHSDYKDEIKKYSGVKYAAFDKDGNGNLGYLFELNKELAKFFMNTIVSKNPELSMLCDIIGS